MTVIGDPAGMRAGAARAQLCAEQLTDAVAQITGTTSAMVYAGPAADEWKAYVAECGDRLRSAASMLERAAQTLLVGAAAVEEQQQMAASLANEIGGAR